MTQDSFFKARGWWPRSRSSTIFFFFFFWQFVFLWVNLALLKPMKRFPWSGCVVQATKNKEKSCSFLDAIGSRSCSRSADWLKIDMWENPSFDSSGSRQLVGTLRCALSLLSGSGHKGAGQKAARHFGACQKVARSFRSHPSLARAESAPGKMVERQKGA